METLVLITFIYMFIAIYFFFFFIILYIRNRKDIFSFPIIKKYYDVSVIIPAYNEEENIEGTLRAVLDSDYRNLIEVIVVNDGSSDNTARIVKRVASKNRLVRLINKKNSGKANSINKALKIAKGELIAIIDADSYLEKDAIRKMIGYFDEDKVAAVTSTILVKRVKKKIEKLQAFEYAIIALTRKLLDYINSVYVTPGALSIYRKQALIDIGGFNPNNVTEDIEVTWNLIHHGYKTRMSMDSRVYTICPRKIRIWWNQRIRWGVGGLQTLIAYRKDFMRRGLFGLFVIPFVFISIFLGLAGFFIAWYILFRKLFHNFFYIKYSFIAKTSLVTFEEISKFTPTIIMIFGTFLFLGSLWFTIFGLGIMNEKRLYKGKSFFNLFFYMLVYLAIYPVVWVVSIYKLFGKDIRWYTK